MFVCWNVKLLKVLQKDAEQERDMRAEIQEMKKEHNSVSMMDEFARYARLERKINKMTDKLKTHGERDTQFKVGLGGRCGRGRGNGRGRASWLC